MIINVNQIVHHITIIHHTKTKIIIIHIEEMITIRKAMDIKQNSMVNMEVIIIVVLHITNILQVGIIQIVIIPGITSTENNQMITSKKFKSVHIHVMHEPTSDMMIHMIEIMIHDMKNALVPVLKIETTMHMKEKITLKEAQSMIAKITIIHRIPATIDSKNHLICLHKK